MRRSQAPDGFEIVKRTVTLSNYPYKRERIYYRCMKRDDNGSQCIFEIRNDKLKNSNLKHMHQFELRFPSRTTVELNSLQNEILDIQCDFIAASNISLYFASSSYFKHYTLELLKIGNKIGSEIEISKLTKKLTFRNIRRTILNKSEKIREKGIRKFQIFLYASIAIDSGTVNKTSYFV